MKAIDQNNSRVNAPGLWRELYTIFLFYLKIFLGAIILGTIFFFLYAGIKTGNIPLSYIIFAILGLLGIIIYLIVMIFLILIPDNTKSAEDYRKLETFELTKYKSKYDKMSEAHNSEPFNETKDFKKYKK